MSADATSDLLARRERLLGPGVPTFYDEPVHVTRGKGVWLWDAGGRRYLDAYNNVPHVGHCHPEVVDAICTQSAKLNTHTRYLHEGILDYLEALLARFAPPLSTGLLTCTGSEANDVALRMARAATGNSGIIATDFTYHGNTAAVSQLSGARATIGAREDWAAFVPAPDSYRPLGGEAGMAHARAFAGAVEAQIAALKRRGHGLAAMVLCPFFANEGFPDLPRGWLDPALAAVRRAGGVVIADEVQPGFGRLGSHFWGHQRIGITPEIVTIGKPMANGHPMGGVITSAEIMAEFRSRFRYFNTFAGNPVSVAAAQATLRVLDTEGLVANAQSTGDVLRDGLHRLAKRHEAIGDVRGAGLFLGAELVRDRATRDPDAALTAHVTEEMRRRGVLLNHIGIHGNVLKIRPPMPFGEAEAALLLDTLDAVLSSAPASR